MCVLQCPVDSNGLFMPIVKEFAGLHVKAADEVLSRVERCCCASSDAVAVVCSGVAWVAVVCSGVALVAVVCSGVALVAGSRRSRR